jgi:hypothetical protein
LTFSRSRWGCISLLWLVLLPAPAAAGLPVRGSEAAGAAMPAPAEVVGATRRYPVTAVVSTNHAGWRESSGYVNIPQRVRVAWHADAGGRAELRGRDAWNPRSPWRELGRWGRGTGSGERGAVELAIDGPTLLWLRVKGPKFPRSGVASLKADFHRRTLAVLRGAPSASRRPVLIAEGYDPFNEADQNDTGWQDDPTLARMIADGRSRYGLDPWLLDWGDGGASMEELAEDFAEIARQVRAWNAGRRETVAVGFSMGSVAIRRALAGAADAREDLGIRKYVSINGPHRGAWINPQLVRFVLRRLEELPAAENGKDSFRFALDRAVDSPAARQLLIGRPDHDAFYRRLRGMARDGYDPSVERVGFSNGTLVREGSGLADLVRGRRQVTHRVLVRPFWLPFRISVHKTYRRFRYDAYPGELLPSSLRMPVREHVKVLGFLRVDLSGRWERIPAFIPTHSALDFPEDLSGGPQRFRYARWQESAFQRMYVAAGRNLAHDDTRVDWIDPRTGQRAPGGQNAVLYEIARAFGG